MTRRHHHPRRELDALRLSLEVASRSVLFSLPFAVLIAWVLDQRAHFPGRSVLDAFVHLPLVLPPVAVGYVLLLLFGTHGAAGRLAQSGIWESSSPSPLPEPRWPRPS